MLLQFHSPLTCLGSSSSPIGQNVRSTVKDYRTLHILHLTSVVLSKNYLPWGSLVSLFMITLHYKMTIYKINLLFNTEIKQKRSLWLPRTTDDEGFKMNSDNDSMRY